MNQKCICMICVVQLENMSNYIYIVWLALPTAIVFNYHLALIAT